MTASSRYASIMGAVPPPGGPPGCWLRPVISGMMSSRSPSAWAVPPDHDNEKDPYGKEWIDAYSDIAQTHGVPVIGVSNIGTIADGPWAQWSVIGASLVVSHDGRVQQQFDYTATDQRLYVIDVALKKQNDEF